MRTAVHWTGATALLALAAACGSGNGGLSVSARSAATAAAATPAGLSLPNGLGISRIRLAVRRISVEGGDASGRCSLGDDGECELSFGPFDVDLAGSALAGGVAFAFDAPIPAGTYREIAIQVNTIPPERAGGNPVLLDLAAAHASILVDGWIEESSSVVRPFQLSTPMEVKQKREGAIVIGPSSNVTLQVDASGWFGGPGARLDPTDPAAQGAIRDAIRASFRLLKDDDEDGIDDDDGPNHR